MTRFAARQRGGAIWVSYDGCSAVASSSPTGDPALAGEQRPGWMPEGMEVQLYDGREDLEVVGEASYQDNLWRVVGGHGASNDRVRMEVLAVLVAETDNPYDANAVSVWIRGLRVGYLSREDARRYRPGLLALEQQQASRLPWPAPLSVVGCAPAARAGSASSSTTTQPTSALARWPHPDSGIRDADRPHRRSGHRPGGRWLRPELDERPPRR